MKVPSSSNNTDIEARSEFFRDLANRMYSIIANKTRPNKRNRVRVTKISSPDISDRDKAVR